jgi:hypothetical protein
MMMIIIILYARLPVFLTKHNPCALTNQLVNKLNANFLQQNISWQANRVLAI